ncbi:MAG: hypothetical protein HOC09_37130, partial [Deltaproteobacteria bacterium]|nr:hypothetical protein [Deltaproteobacteria bacterium]
MKIHNIRKTGLVLALLWLAMVIVQGTFFTAQARPEREISKIARQLLTQLDREYQGKEVLQVRATLFPGENSCAVSPFSAMLHKALQREINRGTLAFQGGELVELRGTYSLDRQLSIKGVLVDLQNGRLIAETLINIAPANLSTKWFAIDPEGFLASVPDCILDRLAKDFPNNPETAVSVAGFRDSASGLPSVFSRLFKKRMEEAVVNSQRFKPSDGVFFLGGTYSLDARFHLTVRITDHRHHAFSLVNLTLPGASVNRNWFQVYLDDHIQVMVDKLANNIPGHENVVLATNDITYRDSGAGSGLGRYLSNHLHMLLSKHPRFTVVEYRKTKRIVGSKNYRGLKKRRVGRDEITMQIGATNYLAGQYWDLGPDTIQLSLKIHTPGHRLA